jgi:putative protein-disulfide isomerase
MTQPDLELVYVGDPMCSWCWGFAPVLEQLDARFTFPIRTVAGGLRPGDAGEVLDDRLRAVLLHHWDQVAERSGQPFDRRSLDREGWRYDTLVPDTAVVAMRAEAPDETLRFFTSLQRAFYADAIDITDREVYPDLVAGFPVDPGRFGELLDSDDMRRATEEDFAEARRLGASGFPTLLLRDGDEMFLATQGYVPHDPLAEALESFIAGRHPGAAVLA